MVDTHTSNGADYPYTMTLIHTQTDKLGNGLGPFLQDTMLPHIFAAMESAGWPTCPYVNPVKDSPDHGIAEFLEVPRFSTGFAALHHVIGFMPETHMLKPFADRYASNACPARHHDGVYHRTWRDNPPIARTGQDGGTHASRMADPLGHE